MRELIRVMIPGVEERQDRETGFDLPGWKRQKEAV